MRTDRTIDSPLWQQFLLHYYLLMYNKIILSHVMHTLAFYRPRKPDYRAGQDSGFLGEALRVDKTIDPPPPPIFHQT